MLSAMRVGRLEQWHIEEFYKLSRPLHYQDGIEPTQLYVTCFRLPRMVLLNMPASLGKGT
ncbi:hypothetical protein EDC04DRAFT_2638826 [Pisolithus marmoratus]|nr:hypothetical protein EDC04DRAFT_2638826 [Pisolithus marmoratus]